MNPIIRPFLKLHMKFKPLHSSAAVRFNTVGCFLLQKKNIYLRTLHYNVPNLQNNQQSNAQNKHNPMTPLKINPPLVS